MLRSKAKRLRCELLEPRTLLAVVPLIDSGSSVRALAPTLEEFSDFGFDWTGVAEPFDDSAWQTGTRGVGYDINPESPYANYIGLSIEAAMLDNSATALVRAPFTVADPTALTGLSLRLRYDDGFIAWINGVEVLRRNALGVYPAWNSGAAAAHTATSTFSSFDMTPFLALLQPGPNVLAIRGLNVSASDSDFLIQAELEARDDRPPTANADVAIGVRGVAVALDVLGNDAPGTSPLDPGSVRIVLPPQFGTASVNADGTVSYTPLVGHTGPDTFTYTVRDTSAAVGPGTTVRTLVSANAPAKALIPTDDEFGKSWTGGSEPFNDLAWRSGTLGVGYDTRVAVDDYRPYYDLGTLDMRFANTSAYVRVPFVIDYPAEVQQLTLRMRYDDGFVAYLNGVEVARANAPSFVTYNSNATASPLDADAVVFENFDISAFASALEAGGNLLAIHGLNDVVDSTDFLIQPELLATVTTRGRVSNVAAVQLNVLPPNPVANDDAAQTLEQTPVAIDVLANDEAGPLGFPLDSASVEVVASPANGSLAVDSTTGAISYSPADGFVGQDSFTYRVRDTAPGEGVFGPTTIVPFNSIWKYLPLGPDQGPVSVWAVPEFDDSSWPSGPAELGYGDFDESTLLPADPVNSPTVYFRRTFDVADPAQIYELGITLYRDDGAVVYLNGVEVARSNMLPGPVTFRTLAPQFAPDDGQQAFEYVIPRHVLDGLLQPGANTIAAEVHQYADISSDLSFELGLTAEMYSPPGRTSNGATVTITVATNPNKPATVADAYTLGEDEPFAATAGQSPPGVLDNDTDPNLDPLSAILVAAPTHGTLSLATDGSFTYLPAADFFGVDSFTYRASDGVTVSLPATVTLTVEPRNDPPRTTPDEYVVSEGESLDSTGGPSYDEVVAGQTPLAYWRLGEGAGATAEDETGAFHGTYVGGVLRGRPGALFGDPDTSVDFLGADGYVDVGYRAPLDLRSNFSISAWINLDSVAGDRRIVSNPNAASSTAGYAFGVVDGRLRFTVYNVKDYDTVTVIAPGRWYHVAVVFDSSYDASFYLDGQFLEKINGSAPVNASPLPFKIGAGSRSFFDGRLDEVVVFNRSLTTQEVESQYLAGYDGTVPALSTFIPLNSAWKYRDDIPNGASYPVDGLGDLWIEPGYNDSQWPSGAGLLGYGTINAAPVATTLGYGGNASDKYRTALFRRTFDVVDAERVAALTFTMLVDDGAAFYINGREVLRRLLPGALGDGSLRTDTLASVGDEDNYQTITVEPASFPDLLIDGTNTIAVEVHQTASNSSDLGFDLSLLATILPAPPVVGVLFNDVDPDGDALIASLFSAPQHGTVDFRSDGTFIYTPAAGFAGVDTFEYTVSDGTAESDPTTVTINVAHLPPAAVADDYSTNEDTSLVVPAHIGVLANDADTQSHALAAILIAPPEHGSLSLGDDGSFTYMPHSDYHGPDRFTYKASDGSLDSAAATVSIVVNSVNDAPVATNEAYTIRRGGSLDASVPILFTSTTPGSSTLISTSGGEFFYDSRLHRFYAESSGQIRRYDVATASALPPFVVPSTLAGCDISVDHRYLYCADGQTGPNVGFVQKIDFSDGSMQTFSFSRGEYETGGNELVVGASGIAMFQHGFAGSGSTPLRRFDTATDTFMSSLGEQWHGPSFYSGPGKQTIAVIERTLSIGGIGARDGYTFADLGAISFGTNNGGIEAAISRDGELVALSCCGGVSIRSRNLQALRTVESLSTPFEFDPIRDVLYATDRTNDQVVAVDTLTWQERFRVPIQENVTGGGSMIVSSNGQYVFVRTPSGIRMIDIRQSGQYVGVLGNDADVDRDVLSVQLVQGPQAGSLTLRSDGTFTYTAEASFAGTVSFTYRISDGMTQSNLATATINVLPVLADPTGDGRFDRHDMAVLARNFGKSSGATLAQGDLTGDGAVTLADASLLQTIMGASLQGPAASPTGSAAAAVVVVSARDAQYAPPHAAPPHLSKAAPRAARRALATRQAFAAHDSVFADAEVRFLDSDDAFRRSGNMRRLVRGERQ